METVSRSLAGYLHPQYADALAEFGVPLRLPRSDGWLLRRPIADTDRWDAMGCYPLFCCSDWSKLSTDLDDLQSALVSVVVVTDPFGGCDESGLASCFDQVRYFKSHYAVDFERPIEENVKRSVRATARRALRKLDVEIVPQPEKRMDTWMELFGAMTQKHRVSGLRAFSRESFIQQFTTPGALMFEARSEGETVGLDMLYMQGDVAYGHLCAFSEVGNKLRASYATRWRMVEYLRDKVRWLDFGGGAGTNDSSKDGLVAYKIGWCSTTRPTYLCGRVFDRETYADLSRALGASPSDYFPAYRSGEFTDTSA